MVIQKFQILIGILQTGWLVKVLTLAILFQILIGILQTSRTQKSKKRAFEFQILIGILQTSWSTWVADKQRAVSNPYRYSTNWGILARED